MGYRRAVRHVIAFVLLGAVVNVVVAWGFALIDHELDFLGSYKDVNSGLWHKWGLIESICLDVPGEVRLVQLPKRWHGTGIADRWWEGPNWEVQRNSHIPAWSMFRLGEPLVLLNEQGGHSNIDYTERATGWPFLALRYTLIEKYIGPPHRMQTDSSDGLLVIPWSIGKCRRDLPFRPIWVGFAINSIVFGSLLCLLTVGPLMLRRDWRRRRNRCPHCGYTVGTSPNCTECGERLQR